MIETVKETPQQKFGRNINRLRTQAKLSQEALAERVDVSRTYIQGMERGVENPTFNVIIRLGVALDRSWDDLFHGI